jgi:hypothetical protein
LTFSRCSRGCVFHPSTSRLLSLLTPFLRRLQKCKLQMQPPSLTYTRQLRKASSCSISFYPSCDPSRLVTHPHAVLILLTDLFLVCERATTPSPSLQEGQDLWLVYPPLAGKHLAVDDGRARGEIEVTVMRKERLTFRFEDERSAADWREQIEETRAFGMSRTFPSHSFDSQLPLSFPLLLQNRQLARIPPLPKALLRPCLPPSAVSPAARAATVTLLLSPETSLSPFPISKPSTPLLLTAEARLTSLP